LLKTFIEIIECGSFTAAAKRVCRSQAAVSMQIKRLEECIGYDLFERTGRGTRPTSSGEMLYDHARRILRDYEEAALAFGAASIEGNISIGLPDDIARTYLPWILSCCLRRFPGLRITAVCESSRQLVAQVGEGQLDLAVVLEGEGVAGGVLLRRERPVWVSKVGANVDTLNPVPLAIFHTGDVFRKRAVERLEAVGRRSRVVLTSVNFAGIRAAIEAGVAVAVVFRENVEAGWRILAEADGYPPLPDLGMLLLRNRTQTSVVVDYVGDELLRVFSRQQVMSELEEPDNPRTRNNAEH
jgi:DNA-binding transcriptional LysR family regulator